MIDQKFVDNANKTNSALMINKVTADIAFLEDKLNYLNNQITPNKNVIKIYSEMLSSRESVLAWLSNNYADIENETFLDKTAINH